MTTKDRSATAALYRISAISADNARPHDRNGGSMDWQEEAGAVRTGALAILRKHGEWIAPSAFAQNPVQIHKATVGDFQVTLSLPKEDAASINTEAAKSYRLQIWWKGKQVAHMEWRADDSSIACRTFAKGEWRDDLAALRP